MITIKNINLQFSRFTIKRQLLGLYYLSNVRLHSVSILTDEVAPAIEYIQNNSPTYDDFIMYISRVYEDDNAVEYFTELISEWISLGILKNENNNEIDSNKSTEVMPETDDDINIMLQEEAIKNKSLLRVTIELTYHCNLSCKHCFNKNNSAACLDKNFYFALLDELYSMNVLFIVFTGGEIFTRDDTLEIIRYACSLDFVVDIYTNGTLINEKILKELADTKIYSMQSSIYSVIPQKHDSFVGVNNAFTKTFNNLAFIRKCGVLTAIKTCVLNFNIDEIEELEKLARSIGATFQYTCSILPQKNTGAIPMNANLSLVDYGEFISHHKQVFINSRTKNDPVCSAGQSSLSIAPDGRVYMCNAFDLPVGSLLSTSLQDIWNKSDYLIKWKKKRIDDLEDCRNCSLFEYCDYCPGAAYTLTDNPLGAYNYACEGAKIAHDVIEGVER